MDYKTKGLIVTLLPLKDTGKIVNIHTSCFILRGNITELYVYLCTVCDCFSFTKSAIPCSFSNRCLSVPYDLLHGTIYQIVVCMYFMQEFALLYPLA